MGQYDVESPVNRYGDSGAAAYRGFQMELMRRAAANQALAATQRQAQLDEQNRKVQEDALLTSKANREAVNAQREATTRKTNLDSVVSTLAPGAALDEATAGMLRKNGGAALILGKPATPEMTMGVPSEFAAAPEGAAASEVPITPAAPATEEFKGTPDQQETEHQKAFAREVLAGAHDTENERLNQFMRTQATQILGGGKFGAVPAGIINAEKVPGETKAAHDLKMEGVERDLALGKPVDPSVKAEYDVWKSRNSTDDEKAKKSADAAEAAGLRTENRQNERFAEQARTRFRTLLNQEDTKAADGLERVARAQEVLRSKNFLADALAAPEVLQLAAGGMGSGLRMTDAELNRVNTAQSYIDQLKGRLAKAGIGEQVTIQEALRKQMQDVVDIVQTAKTRLEKVRSEYRRKIADAKDPNAVDALQAEYGMARMDALSGKESSPAASAPAAGTKRLTYNPKTGKVE